MNATLDWRQVGQELEAKILALRTRLPSQRMSTDDCRAALPQPLRAFVKAALEHAAGDPTALAEYLKSDAPLERRERSLLADLLQWTPRRRRGNPGKPHLHFAAAEARAFLADWVKANHRLDIKDRGHRPDMKGEAVRFVFENLHSDFLRGEDSEQNRDVVLALIDRPKNRRRNFE